MMGNIRTYTGIIEGVQGPRVRLMVTVGNERSLLGPLVSVFAEWLVHGDAILCGWVTEPMKIESIQQVIVPYCGYGVYVSHTDIAPYLHARWVANDYVFLLIGGWHSVLIGPVIEWTGETFLA